MTSAESPPGTTGSMPDPQGLTTRVWVEQIMGLPISIHVRTDAPESSELAEAVQAVFARLRQIDATFSTYREDSDIRRIQRGELRIIDAHPDVARVHEACKELLDSTEGLFNAWPLDQGRPRFDPTGWVKGWGVQEASRPLLERADQDSYINAGGDIQARINRTDTLAWRVGIENPFDPQTLADIVEVRSGAVATSGTYARGHHIRDAAGEPAIALASVTVTGEELQWVDAYATAAFAAGSAGVDWLRNQSEYSALVIDAQGDVHPVRWVSAAHRQLSTDPTFISHTDNLQ